MVTPGPLPPGNLTHAVIQINHRRGISLQGLQTALDLLHQNARPDELAGMARFGIVGEGRLGLSVPTMRLKTYPSAADRSWWKEFEVGVVGMVRDDPLKHQMEHFGAVVRGEVSPLVSARDGLQNLRVTEAISLAATSGRVVNL